MDVFLSLKVLFREKDIMYTDGLDDINRKVEVAILIAHETISYWFKDIILWSKEGFVTFLSALLLTQVLLYIYIFILLLYFRHTFRLYDKNVNSNSISNTKYIFLTNCNTLLD